MRKTHSLHKLTSEYTVFFSSKAIHDALRKRNLQISRLIIIDGSNDNNSVANYLETGKWLYINTILYKLVIKYRIHFIRLTNWNVFHDKIPGWSKSFMNFVILFIINTVSNVYPFSLLNYKH